MKSTMLKYEKFAPDTRFKINIGLFYGGIHKLDETLEHKGQIYYKLTGSSHFWKPEELKEV